MNICVSNTCNGLLLLHAFGISSLERYTLANKLYRQCEILAYLSVFSHGVQSHYCMNHELLNITISDQIFRDTMIQIH